MAEGFTSHGVDDAPNQQPASISVRQPWQFSLKTLFIGIAVWAVFLTAVRYFGWFAVPCAFAAAAVAFCCYGQYLRATGSLGLAAMTFVLTAGLPGGPYYFKCSLRDRDSDHVREIIKALQSYSIFNGHFPPAVVYDNSGRPMHSWRALILREIGQEELAEQYNLYEPWDGPHNIQLAKEIASIYRSPYQTGADTDAGFVAVTGPGTIWDSDAASDLEAVFERNPIVIVPVANSGIHWLEPRDLTLDDLDRGLNSDARRGISSANPEGVWVGTRRGDVMKLPKDIAVKDLKRLFLVAPDGR